MLCPLQPFFQETLLGNHEPSLYYVLFQTAFVYFLSRTCPKRCLDEHLPEMLKHVPHLMFRPPKHPEIILSPRSTIYLYTSHHTSRSSPVSLNRSIGLFFTILHPPCYLSMYVAKNISICELLGEFFCCFIIVIILSYYLVIISIFRSVKEKDSRQNSRSEWAA